MLGTNVRDSTVNNNNNRVNNSGNTNTFNVHNGSIHLSIKAANALKDGTNVPSASVYSQDFKVLVQLPFRRNKNFCGRQDILGKLCQIFDSNTPGLECDSQRKTVVLYGMGGVGKSQIALEYAHRYADCYSSIFWIDANDPTLKIASACTIMQQIVIHYATKQQSTPDYQEIAKLLGIPGKIDSSGKFDQSVAVEAVHYWLSASGNRRWLILVDNHDKADLGELAQLIPTCDWGSVIFTTRLRDFDRFLECIEVDEIGVEAGLDMLLKSSGKYQQASNDSELGVARDIVKTLGELPLALDQAGAYIRFLQSSFSAYRKKLELGMKASFKNNVIEFGLNSDKASVLTTWELSFQELSDDARHLLHLCAFLSNEDIPDELFRRGKSAVDWTLQDEDRLENALGELFTLSLAKRKNSNDSFWIHPLVHTWTRERIIDDEMRQRNAEQALTLIASAIPGPEHQRSSDESIFERRILNQLRACQDNISRYFSGSDNRKVFDASQAIGSAFKNLGFYNQAEASYQIALAGYEKGLGSDAPLTLGAVNSLARVFEIQGRYDEALVSYQRALKGREKVLGKDDPETLITVDNIAAFFLRMGRYDDALEWFQRALAGNEMVLGKDHTKTLGSVDGMAAVFWRLGRDEEALKLLHRALAGKEKILVKHIANIFHKQGRYDEALSSYQRALVGQENALGKDHPLTLMTVDNIGSVLNNQGRYDEAHEWRQRALAGIEKSLGKDHPETLCTVNNIAIAFLTRGRYQEAIEWFQRTLTGREKALGKDHPEPVPALITLALPSANKAGTTRRSKKSLVKDHPDTLMTMDNIGLAFRKKGRYDEALEWHHRALAGEEKVLAKDHPLTLETVDNIGSVLFKKDRCNEALEWHQRAFAGREKVLGKHHPDTLTTVDNIGSVFSKQGQYDEALAWHQKALAGREKALEKDHPDILITVGNIGSVFSKQGRYDEALESFQSALVGLEKTLGKDHPDTMDIVKHIGLVFRKQGRYDDALEWLQRALAGYEEALGNTHPSTLDTLVEIQRANDGAVELEQSHGQPPMYVLYRRMI
ncbi:hypothetical protein RUND412_002924 [Rhizina undulata]